MNRRKILAIVATAAALGTGGVLLLGASAGAITQAETLTLRDKETSSVFVDINQNGPPDPGDYLVLHSVLSKGGAVVGYTDAQCVVSFGDQVVCHGAAVITGRGQITVEGSLPASEVPTDFDLAVTGGTGDFANVRGYVHVHPLSDTVSIDTLFLLP